MSEIWGWIFIAVFFWLINPPPIIIAAIIVAVAISALAKAFRRDQ